MSNVAHTKNPTRVRARHEIVCAECTGSAVRHCWCLSEKRLYRETMPLLPGLLKSVSGVSSSQSIVYLAARRKARQALEQLVAQEEQRAREEAAYRAFVRDLFENPHPRFAASRDREILEHLFGYYRRSSSIRTLDDVALAWHRPAAYVRDLRDRCLKALRRWPTENRATASRMAVA